MPKGLYTRNGVFYARFKIRGIEYRPSLRTRSEKVAEKRLKNVREAIEERVYYGGAEIVSWKQAFVSWNEKGPEAAGIKASTFERYITSVGQLDPWLGDKMLHEIDNRLLKQIVADRQRHGVTNATIRRDMTAVSSVLLMRWIWNGSRKTPRARSTGPGSRKRRR